MDIAYGKLLALLEAMTPDELAQRAQVMVTQADGDKPVELLPARCCDTLRALGVKRSRSSYDNKHHPASVVVMAELGPFILDGKVVGECVRERLEAPAYTYEYLRADLKLLSHRELDQLVQVLFNPDGEMPAALLPVIIFETVGKLEVENSLSSYDGKHHPEDFVIYVDHNPYARDGSIGYNMLTGKKIYPKGHPKHEE